MRTLNFPQELIKGLAGLYLSDYESPEHERSLYKGIPIEYRYHPTVLAAIAGSFDNKGRVVRLRPMYRGVSKPNIGYKRNPSYVPKQYADSFALYPQYPRYEAETSLSSRNDETFSMNEPITYPVGTGNVIGSHSAQDFVWAGRAEGSQEQATGETATHTPADTNTPYAGPITEPIGSDVHFGAEKVSWSTIKTLNYYIGAAAIIIGVGGFVGILSTQLRANKLWGVGTLFTGVKDSWDSKDIWSKTLMLTTFGSLVYLGWTASTMTYRYSGRSTVGQ
jgi:hypothetical protein